MLKSLAEKPLAEKPLAPSPATPVDKAQRRRRRLAMSERGLGVAGLALAVCSGAFASYMISDKDRRPTFSGSEYLTVFAKLTPSGSGARPSAAPADAPDPMPTASIAPAASGGYDFDTGATPIPANSLPFNGRLPLRGYVLRYVFQGAALLESPEGLKEVRPGTVLPDAGTVTSIEQRAGKWVVVTSRGFISDLRR